MSITNAVEQIAAEVIEGHPEVIDPFSIAAILGVSYTKPFLWIEHYEDGARGTPEDPATLDLVEFESYEAQNTLRAGEWVKEIGRSSWKPLTREMVEALSGDELR